MLGKKAFKCIDKLNESTGRKFNQVAIFRDESTAKQTMQSFYKENTKMKLNMSDTYTNFFNASKSKLVADGAQRMNLDTTDRLRDTFNSIEIERSNISKDMKNEKYEQMLPHSPGSPSF